MTGEVEKDTKTVLELGQELLDVKPDPEIVKRYMELGMAMHSHEPERLYDGNVLLIRASDPSSYTAGLPNEDYNVFKVSYVHKNCIDIPQFFKIFCSTVLHGDCDTTYRQRRPLVILDRG